jgi:hypothetical protein
MTYQGEMEGKEDALLEEEMINPMFRFDVESYDRLDEERLSKKDDEIMKWNGKKKVLEDPEQQQQQDDDDEKEEISYDRDELDRIRTKSLHKVMKRE